MTGQDFVGTWDDAIPERVSVTCGWCTTAIEALRVGSSVELSRIDQPGHTQIIRVAGSYVCPRRECHRPILVFFEVYEQLGRTFSDAVIGQLPRGQAIEMEHLPDTIQSDRLEAWSCFHGGDLRAAIIMGRAAIQRAVRSLDAVGRGLKAELQDLQQNGTITAELKKWGDEVRIAGDDAAHPQELGVVNREEAEESLEFMDEFLRHTIAMPARRRAREEDRRLQAEDD